MKLKKIASLMLAGIMAVSMLAGCGEGKGNGNSGSSSSQPTVNTGLSAEVVGMSAFKSLKNVTGVDNATLQKAVDAAAAVHTASDDCGMLLSVTDIDNFSAGQTMLAEASKLMGNADYEQWAKLAPTAGNDGNTAYDIYAVSAALSDSAIKQLVADKLKILFDATNISSTVVPSQDSYSYEVNVAFSDWQVGQDANVNKDGVLVGIAITLTYNEAKY